MVYKWLSGLKNQLLLISFFLLLMHHIATRNTGLGYFMMIICDFEGANFMITTLTQILINNANRQQKKPCDTIWVYHQKLFKAKWLPLFSRCICDVIQVEQKCHACCKFWYTSILLPQWKKIYIEIRDRTTSKFIEEH